MTKKLCIAIAVLMTILSIEDSLHAQSQSRHVIVPDGKHEHLEFGNISWQVVYLGYNLLLHNPTDMTLWYYGGGGFSYGDGGISFPTDDYYTDVTIVGPNDSVYLLFYGNAARGGDEVIHGDSYIGYTKPYEPYDSVKDEDITFSVNVKFRNDDLIEVFQDQFVYKDLYACEEKHGETLINDQDSTVIVKQIALPRGSRYHVTGFSSPLPDTLEQGETLTVYYYWGDPDTAGFEEEGNEYDTTKYYYDLLYILTVPNVPSSATPGDILEHKYTSTVGRHATIVKSEVSTYPNPATKTLHISVNDGAARRVVMYDMTGALVRSEVVSGEAEWDVSTLPSGSYMLGIPGEGMQMVQVVK